MFITDIDDSKSALQDSLDALNDRVVLTMGFFDLPSDNNNERNGSGVNATLEVNYTPQEIVSSEDTQAESEDICGIGVGIIQDNEGIKVAEVIEGSPAYKAGIQEGDWFVAVDGEWAVEMDIYTMSEMIKGRCGSIVAITFVCGNQMFLAVLTRQPLPEAEEKPVTEEQTYEGSAEEEAIEDMEDCECPEEPCTCDECICGD